MGENDEVERLKARVAQLEAELSAAGPPPSVPPPPHRRSVWWGVGSAVLIIIACVLAPLSVASVWASTQLSDTERYVETVSPIGEDPAVQKAVATAVSDAVLEKIDVQGLTTEALTFIASQENVPPRVAALLPSLSTPIVNGVEGFVRTQVNEFVTGPQFPVLWDQVNRIAHEQVVKLLEGNEGGAVSAQGDTITLNLAPIVEEVKSRLVARGFDLAANIPTVDKQFVLVQSESITQAQGFYRLLNTLGTWLPFVALALLAAGVLLARDRRRALLKGALGVTAAMLVLGIGLAVARNLYATSTPAGLLTSQSAGDVFDILVRFLRTGIRALAVLGLVVALAAFLSGPSPASVRSRATLEHGIGSLRGSAEGAGLQTGRFSDWVWNHKRALRIAIFLVAGLVLAFWSQPTGWVVVGLALVVALLLAVVEFLGRPPVPAPPQPVPAPTGQEDTIPIPRQQQPEKEAQPHV